MARITVEDCLKQEQNHFALVHLAARRIRQLRKGSKPLVNRPENREVVTALREIAAGKVLKRNEVNRSKDTSGETQPKE